MQMLRKHAEAAPPNLSRDPGLGFMIVQKVGILQRDLYPAAHGARLSEDDGALSAVAWAAVGNG